MNTKAKANGNAAGEAIGAELETAPKEAVMATAKTLETSKTGTRDRFFGEFTEAQIRAAFDKVADAADWKGPIDAVIHRDEGMLVREAVIFFTATVVSFSAVAGDIAAVRVKSEGYRQGPAGDH